MDTRIEPRPACTIVQPDAPLSDGNETELFEAVIGLFNQPGARVVLDLSKVQTLNSSGLGVLVQLSARANLQSGKFVLAGARPYVAGVLELTKLTKFFDVYLDAEEAAKAFEGI